MKHDFSGKNEKDEQKNFEELQRWMLQTWMFTASRAVTDNTIIIGAAYDKFKFGDGKTWWLKSVFEI